AFTNLARIDASCIGRIEIKGDRAFVDIDEEVAKRVVDIMKDEQIGGVNVRVYPENPEKLLNKQVYDYLQKYRKLVELERKEEMERHLSEIKRLSGREREEKGRAILHLRGRDQGEGYAGKHLIKFLRQRQGESLPDNEIQVGDLVMLSKNNPLDRDNPSGTVVEKTAYSLTVVFDKKPPAYLYKKGLRMDLYVNDITFQRMLEALDRLGGAEGRLAELREILLGERVAGFNHLPEMEFHLDYLNSSQQNAVKNARAARELFLIHGPPGTGKTMTCIELILQGVKAGETILAAADSNTAVDNLVERLIESGTEVVRVGHPARVTPVLRQHTLDYLLEDNQHFQKAREIRQSLNGLFDKQDKLTHPGGRWRRGLSNQQIHELARKKRGTRGVPAGKIREMSDWLKVQERVDEAFEEINKLEEQAVKEILEGADVLCATNSTAGSELLASYDFDLVVIDEATQSTEPSALIPFIKGKRVVLAGDHKQLPPTVLNQKAEQMGLSQSLFERLLEIHGDRVRALLEIQYRMHDKIMDFSSRQFYEGRLESAPGIGLQTLVQLNITLPPGDTPPERAFREEAISFLDTRNLSASERSRADSSSYENRMEAELVKECLLVVLKSGIKARDIAVISPYKDQVALIKDFVEDDNIEVDTVDGFQGREKEIVIFSCVRSNRQGNIGFLEDLRRLNVAITRAKKRLIMIGDSKTVSYHPVYKDLIEYIKEEGFYYLY
ncbi:MAG TPA: IGHMBP2 family helicase, partial [Halanaerobiales bacterium]|nr:IGHMBP2 family helicase [Halanaerobiales bacterium]